jgi:hypothetical protein
MTTVSLPPTTVARTTWDSVQGKPSFVATNLLRPAGGCPACQQVLRNVGLADWVRQHGIIVTLWSCIAAPTTCEASRLDTTFRLETQVVDEATGAVCQCQADYVPLTSGHPHTDCVQGFCPCRPARAASDWATGDTVHNDLGLAEVIAAPAPVQPSEPDFGACRQCPEPALEYGGHCVTHEAETDAACQAFRAAHAPVQPSPLDDLNPDRLHPPTAWLESQTTYDKDAGVYYVPFVKDGRVGYIVRSNRPGIATETYVYLNPSTGSDDGVPTVFVYQGEHNDPGQDGSECYIVPDGVGYVPGEEPCEGAESEHAAWVAGR